MARSIGDMATAPQTARNAQAAIEHAASSSWLELLERVGYAAGVVIDVVDDGSGMPADFDDKLFARYQWSANNPTTKVTGTGLGLPMAREIVGTHGGPDLVREQARAGARCRFKGLLAARSASDNTPTRPRPGARHRP
jgi:signal transduction histidine kinase